MRRTASGRRAKGRRTGMRIRRHRNRLFLRFRACGTIRSAKAPTAWTLGPGSANRLSQARPRGACRQRKVCPLRLRPAFPGKARTATRSASSSGATFPPSSQWADTRMGQPSLRRRRSANATSGPRRRLWPPRWPEWFWAESWEASREWRSRTARTSRTPSPSSRTLLRRSSPRRVKSPVRRP